MEGIKSYFEIVFVIFITLSMGFIGLKLLLFILEIRKNKYKKSINRYSDKASGLKCGNRGIKKKQTDEIEKSVKSTKISNKDDKYEILKYDNGDTYKGELINGKRSGFGICIFANKDRYEGLW